LKEILTKIDNNFSIFSTIGRLFDTSEHE